MDEMREREEHTRVARVTGDLAAGEHPPVKGRAPVVSTGALHS
jgi:hypothetical protein